MEQRNPHREPHAERDDQRVTENAKRIVGPAPLDNQKQAHEDRDLRGQKESL